LRILGPDEVDSFGGDDHLLPLASDPSPAGSWGISSHAFLLLL